MENDERERGQLLVGSYVLMLFGLSLAVVKIYRSYRFASRRVRGLGGTGTVIVMRLSAFILLAVGVQILCDGLVERFAVLAPLAN